MRNEQLPKGRQTFTRGKSPIVSGAIDPTKEEARAANSGGFAGETRIVKKVGGNKILKAVLAGGAVVGAGAVAYETVPAVHRAVDSAFLDHIKGKSSSSEAPTEVFDNSAAKGTIGPNNILYVPREEFNKTPLADAEGNPIFDFPWDPNHPISRKYKVELSSSWANWSAEGSVEKVPEGIQNKWNENTSLPAGFEFPTPYPGRLFWSGSVYDEEASRKSPSNPYGATVYKDPPSMAKIEFIAPNGVLYFINIAIGEGGGTLIEPLISAPLIGFENNNGRDWEKGTLVERGQPIFRTTKEGKLLMYIEGGKNGRLDGPPKEERRPGNFQFQAGKDPNGAQKLLVPEGK